jgi:ubiquinone/menaquinone biosynthesis C-methylase UbiE
MTSTVWLLLALGLSLLAALLYWLLITTEGVFLGRRVVIWLYDLTAHKYDAIKQYVPADERLLVTRPALAALANRTDPLILDVATGTGRVPSDLMQADDFNGYIVGLDDSARMLARASAKLQSYRDEVVLVRHPAAPLPFARATFDLVTCLEALEFFPSDQAAIREMQRVLKPGGFLMATRRRGWESRAFLHRHRSQERLRDLLRASGLAAVQFHPWQLNYDLVTARKPAGETHSGATD